MTSSYSVEEFDSGLNGWLHRDAASLSNKDGMAQLVVGKKNARLFKGDLSKGSGSVLADWNILEIRMRVKSTSNTGFVNVYFGTNEHDGIKGVRRTAFTPLADGELHTYRMRMDLHPEWSGQLDDLRFDFIGWNNRDTVEVDSIRLNRSRFFQSLGEFNTSTEGWSGQNVDALQLAGGYLKAHATNSNSGLMLVDLDKEYAVDTDLWNILELRMKLEPGTKGKHGEVYWKTSSPNGQSVIGQSTFPITDSDGKWKTYFIYLGDNPSWNGQLQSLRLDPLKSAMDTGRSFEIDHIRLRRSYAIASAEFRSGLDEWTPVDLRTQVAGGQLKAIADSAEAHLLGPNVSEQRLDLFFYNMVELVMKIEGGGTDKGQIHFTTDQPNEGTFSTDRSRSFSTVADDKFHTYRVYMGEHPHWVGNLKQLRLDPVSTEGSRVITIDSIRLVRAPVTLATETMLADVNLEPEAGTRPAVALETILKAAKANRRHRPEPYTGTLAIDFYRETLNESSKATDLAFLWYLHDYLQGGLEYNFHGEKAKEILLAWIGQGDDRGMNLATDASHHARCVGAWAFTYSLIYPKLCPQERAYVDGWFHRYALKLTYPHLYAMNDDKINRASNGRTEHSVTALLCGAVTGDKEIFEPALNSRMFVYNFTNCIAYSMTMESESGNPHNFNTNEILIESMDGEMVDRVRRRDDKDGNGIMANASLGYAFLNLSYLLYASEIAHNNGYPMHGVKGPIHGESAETALEFYAPFVIEQNSNANGLPLPEGTQMNNHIEGDLGKADGETDLYYRGSNHRATGSCFDIGRFRYPDNSLISAAADANPTKNCVMMHFCGTLIFAERN